MISQRSIEEVYQAVDIVTVVERSGVKLKRAGSVMKGCCPFHDEKTGSFFIYEKTQSYYCYGCNTGGNAVTYVMKKNNLTFVEAIKELADQCNITLEMDNVPRDEKKESEMDVLKSIYKDAGAYYVANLKDNALKYATSRFNDKAIAQFQIGYAPDQWHGLWDYLQKLGKYSQQQLIQSELFRQNKNGGYYDFFRGRLMFPVFNRVGNIIAFSGRDMSGESEAKYLNSSETLLYKKKSTLYGLNFAIPTIKKYDVVILVEGNPDVVKLHQLGIHNVVAACGTALNEEHLKTIAQYTKNICLLYDGDSAGLEATRKNGLKIIQEGHNCSVINIPTDNGKKQDPDSFFTNKEQFVSIYTKERREYVLILAEDKRDKCIDNPATTSKVMLEISRLFYKKTDQQRASLIDNLSKIIPTKTLWNKSVKELENEEKALVKSKEISERTQEQNTHIAEYGFYMHNNCYFFQKDGGTFFCGSNFIMEPLFHLESTYQAKRMYKLINVYGVYRNIEFPQKDLISVTAFKLKCESMGNFRFDAGDSGLSKIKGYLYAKTRTCKEVTKLGWQKQGFFAWANGIYDGHHFIPIDNYGIVKFKEENYYLPSMSNFFIQDETLYQFERKFVHEDKKDEITLDNWLKKYLAVFGENGLAAFGFYIATIFRDYIFNQFNFFPILNVFGPKGSGKTQLALSLLSLFGKLPGGPNMTNSTLPALADHVSKTCNAICHVEEYKDSVNYDKIEFLKGLWDGTGRSRINIDKDKKKEVTAVDCGVVLTGQEMPNRDIALFSRVVFLSYSNSKFSEEAIKRLDELNAIQRQGLTHITNELLSYRDDFEEQFTQNYFAADKEMSAYFGNQQIETRLWRNWIIVIAALRTICNVRGLPIIYESALSSIAPLITIQQNNASSGNEVGMFWKVFEWMISTGTLEESYHYKIKIVDNIKTDKGEYNGPIKVLIVNINTVLMEYTKNGKQAGVPVIPIKSMEYYLQHSPEYLGRRTERLKTAIKNTNDRTNIKPEIDGYSISVCTVRCDWFNYDKLDVDIEKTFVKEE